MQTETMQAVRVLNYGGAEQLVLEQVPRPEPQAQEVLLRVHAAGVNPVDWKIRQGMMKGMISIQFPYTPGTDLAGVIEEVGSGVTTFQKGQAVYGETTHGSYAEYAVASTNILAAKPKNLDYDQAASVPMGAMTAWQAIFDHGGLQAGQRILIHGAAGGVGLFAVQFAKWKGAYVIGTASASNGDFVRSLGADMFVDYKSTPIETVAHDMDVVLDTIGGDTQDRSWQVLKPGGILVSVVAPPSEEKAKQYGVRATIMRMQGNSELLQTITGLIETEQVKTTIAQTLPLAEAAQAQKTSESSHSRGRIVLHVTD